MKIRERKNLQRLHNALKYNKPITFTYNGVFSVQAGRQKPVAIIMQDGIRYDEHGRPEFVAINLKRVTYGDSTSSAVRTYKLDRVIGKIKLLK